MARCVAVASALGYAVHRVVGVPPLERFSIRIARIVCIATLLACNPPEPVAQGADLEVYVRQYCETRCSTYEVCDPDPTIFEPCDVATCIEDLEEFRELPCFGIGTELRRCWRERESCESLFGDNMLPVGSDSICWDFEQRLYQCIEAHPEAYPVDGD